ncbi:uncharacterized protein LOC126681652 isoform X2 [Mercurialis annua]|uniref:uncharacterized protein LOC126681652 isoform X2 n=1 Tax=Mercurialis annua TaxID=3986 RepID=UPI00215E59F1|nr:uncharacterized protein LOC126681652 isoform X2 [Mercurialis annua]
MEAERSSNNTSSRDGRRAGASRFLRQMKQSPSTEKFSNKERIKKLSAVNRVISSRNEEKYEMGCDLVEREDANTTASCSAVTKRFKLPRKYFDDCNGVVDRVSVPRKLRSAMKKRNRESISPPFPDSKKLNYSNGGAESSKRAGLKKSKLNLKQEGPNWSIKQSVTGPITKDEEEVVETLYALAGMFPDNERDRKTKFDTSSSDASPSALPEACEKHPPQLEDTVGLKEDLNEIFLSKTDEAVNPALNMEKSHEETVKINSLIRPSICESSDFPFCETLQGEVDSFVSQANWQKIFHKHEQSSLKDAVNYCFPPEPLQDAGKLKQPVKLEIPQLDWNSEITLGLTTKIRSQLDQQHFINESKSNCPALWPGLSSTVSSTFCPGPLPQSFTVRMPAWLGTTSRHGPVQIDSSTEKVSKVSIDRRSWKRCAAHAHISHLIRALAMPNSKESLQLPPSQLKPHEILKQGVIMTINDFNGVRNDLIGAACSSIVNNNIEKYSSDAKSSNLQHLRLRQDHPQHALSSGAYTSHQKSFDFLSLSGGGGGMENINSFSGAGSCPEPLAPVQVPYPAQHSRLVPFSMSQAQYTAVYPNQPSSAAAQQAPHFNNPYCGPQASCKVLTKQQQQQQQQHHRQWTAKLAAQYRNAATSAAMTQFPIWQNGRPDSPAVMPFVLPSSPSTIEVLGHKYPQISLQQQQQPFMTITSPHERTKRQDNHLSSVYEEIGVGFRAGGGALPLQLLCSERL